MTRIVILGSGTAGTMMANRLARRHRRELRTGETSITVVDRDEQHIYQPGLLFVPFGIYEPADIVRPKQQHVTDGVAYRAAGIDKVDPDRDVVVLDDGDLLPYDVLIIATGTRVAPEETEGLTGTGWRERIFDFYTLEGATALAHALESWDGGRLVINVVDLPIKCPVAPLEFAFLADWYFTKRTIRDRVTITLATPLDGAFTKPLASRALGHLLADKGINIQTEFSTGEVRGAEGKLISWDERELDFDVLVSIPLHTGARFVGRSEGLGDDLDFVRTHPTTLQAERKANIFAIGDATNLPTSKAGSVAHFQAHILTENVERYLRGKPLEEGFDGHANCFIETGFDKALLIDFNYDVEPLPGRFPFPGVGPMSLLKESRLNHLGKMAFQWIYWNVLLPGRPMPGIPTRMSMRGKHQPQTLSGVAP